MKSSKLWINTQKSFPVFRWPFFFRNPTTFLSGDNFQPLGTFLHFCHPANITKVNEIMLRWNHNSKYLAKQIARTIISVPKSAEIQSEVFISFLHYLFCFPDSSSNIFQEILNKLKMFNGWTFWKSNCSDINRLVSWNP